MFEYVATGGLTVQGCASPVKMEKYYQFIFGIGSTPYILAKARKGILERIAIKRVNLVGFSGKAPVFNYVDTRNGVWMEYELVWQADAISIATSYLESQIQTISC